ncbi:hypothetical protein GCM10007079_18880 [Nocardiopsis terrae]|nr:hypothetical protein GCM10007079_18880 [Nocardiopsis terrae]
MGVGAGWLGSLFVGLFGLGQMVGVGAVVGSFGVWAGVRTGGRCGASDRIVNTLYQHPVLRSITVEDHL